MASKYDPLTVYLSMLPASQDRVTLSFAEVEGILANPLPPSARRLRSWWANTTHYVHACSWLRAHWWAKDIRLAEEQVTFTRFDAPPLPPRESYGPLAEALSQVPEEQKQLALSFAEVERLAQRALPKTARSLRQWWANTETSPQASAWLYEDWVVQDVFMHGQVVVLRRRGSDILRAISRYVRGLVDGSTRLRPLSATEILRWVRLCRTVGWYFEGATLYERGGITASLGESDRAALDEDYAVCKRELTRYQR